MLSHLAKGEDMYTTEISTTPLDVGHDNVTLKLSFEPVTAMEIGAMVELTLPASGALSFDPSVYSTPPKCKFQGPEALPDIVPCEIEKNSDGREVITWTNADDPASPYDKLWVSAIECITNPESTQETDTFELRIYSDSTKTTLLDQQLTDITITGDFEPIEVDYNFITQKDGASKEVGILTTGRFTLRSNVPLASSAFISVVMPKVNPGAPRSIQLSYIDEATLACSGIQNADAGLTCSLEKIDNYYDKLTIEGIFPNGQLDRDVDMIIEIDGIYNPFSTSPRYFETAISIIGTDGNTYDVQRGSTLWQADEATGFSFAEVTADDTTVQEYTTFTVAFQPNLDTEAGAYVMVQFPTSDNPLAELSFGSDGDAFFAFDPQLQSMATIGGLFGSRKDGVPFSDDSTGMKIMTLTGTQRYSVASIAKLSVSKIQNPVHIGTFGSFRITVFDEDMYKIADQFTDIMYTATSGNILDVKLMIENPAIQKTSDLRLQFAPLHYLETSAIIYIEISIDLKIPCPTEYELNSDQLVQPMNMVCETTSTNTFTIDTPFYEDYKYLEGEHGWLIVAFEGVTTPLSARDIVDLKIETRMADGEIVDEYTSTSTQLTINPSPFFSQNITTDSNETYTATTFTFDLGLADYHNSGGYLDIHLPPEVDVSRVGFALQTLDVYSTAGTELEIMGGTDPSGSDPYILRVINPIPAYEYGQASGYILSIDFQYLVTPLTTVSTSTFKVYTRDRDLRIINYIDSDFYITMKRGKNIEDASISSVSTIVGDITGFTFDFLNPVPLKPTDQIRVMYPDEVLPPFDMTDKCQGGGALNGLQPDCQSIQEVVTAKSLQFGDNGLGRRLAVPTELEVGTSMSFTILGSRNPQTGAPTSSFKIYLQDSNGNVMAEMSDEDNSDMKLTMTEASPISTFNFSLTDDRQQAPTAAKLQWRNQMPYPKDSYIEIRYNQDQIGPRDNAWDDVKCSSNLQLQVECEIGITNQITMKGIFADDLVDDSYIWFVISGLFVDIFEPTITDAWNMTVYTEIDSTSYHIDTIQGELSLEWKCSIPCQTCQYNIVPGGEDICDSCNLMSNRTILYENQCYSECPGATYYDPVGNTCNLCDPTCAECDDKNPLICLSCNKRSGQHLFLDGTTCKAQCPFGSYGNTDESKCLPCQSPCQSCTNGPLDCSTCDVLSEDAAFFMNGDCKKECDIGYTVPIGNADLVCLPCNANCETCVGDQAYCETCKPDGKSLLSMYDHTCHSQCPVGITIGYANGHPKDSNLPFCEVCSDECRTCAFSTSECTSCKDGNYLFGDICIADCAAAFNKRHVNLESDQTCQECSYPCDTCQTFADRCLTCKKGWVMFEYKCVRACPDKYTEDPANPGTCILTGFFCPFGYVMFNGNSCILDLQICEGNDILNYDKTKCIPQPDNFFPFPMLILVLICTIIITYAKCKWFPYMRWIAVMISMLALFELVGLVCLVALSGAYGITPSYLLSFLGLFFLLGLNLFCLLIYLFQLKHDSAFKYWEQEFIKSTRVIVCLGFVINFKIHRMFYSRFWGKRDFEAVFNDEIMFYRSVMFSSLVYIICCIVPILISSVFVIIYVPFGYQLQMFGLEMFIIEVMILILLLIELYKIRKHFLIKAYYKVRSEDMGEAKQFKVMAGIPNQYGSHHSYSSYTVSIMERVINRIDNFHATYRMGESNKVQTIKEICDLREEQYGLNRMRRCVSFTDLRYDRMEIDDLQQQQQSSESELVSMKNIKVGLQVQKRLDWPESEYGVGKSHPPAGQKGVVIAYSDSKTQMFGKQSEFISKSLKKDQLAIIKWDDKEYGSYNIGHGDEFWLQKVIFAQNTNNELVSMSNIEIGLNVQKRSDWPESEYGIEKSHPPSRKNGIIIAFSDAKGRNHGQKDSKKSQFITKSLKEDQVAIIEWDDKERGAYRVGFKDEFWLQKASLNIVLDDDYDQEKVVWENFISEPSSPTATWFPKEQNTKETLRNPYFHGRMQSLSKVYGTRGQFDNCYHQAVPLHLFPYKNCKMVSRTVQANVLELLGVDDLLPQYSNNIQKIKNKNNLNQKIDEEDVHEEQDLDSAADMFSKGLVSKVLDNFEGFQEKKKRRTLPAARVRMLPEFKIGDIQGNLDIDEDGNFIIISDGVDKKGNPILEDLDGHRINHRGYLMNHNYQIVLRNGTIVFREDEIDSDGEIPAPYCYMKKDNLGMNTEMFGSNALPNLDPKKAMLEQDEEEEAINREYQMLRNQGNKNLRYQKQIIEHEVEAERSVRSDDLDNSEAALAPSKQIKRLVQNQPLLYNPNDEDFITQVSRPLKPKPKGYGKMVQNKQLPPKSPKRSTVSAISQQKSQLLKTENDGHTSIDADFLINGNIGYVDHSNSILQINDNFEQPDMAMTGVPLAKRPQSGAPQVRRRGRSSKNRSKMLRPDQQLLLLENTDEGFKRDRELEILEGIEKFQAMISRYPLKPRQSKSTNTLAGKQLNKVYGKIKMQYTRQIQIPDDQLSHAGGMQTQSQFRIAHSRAGYKDGQCYIKNCSIHGNASYKGSASKVFPQNQGALGSGKLKGLSSIYQQDLRNKARAGYTGGQSTFSLKSNQMAGNTYAGYGNRSVQGGGNKIIAMNNDPSNQYMQMDAGSYQEGQSEHEIDEIRVNRELQEMRYRMENNQPNYGEPQMREVRGGMTQSFNGSQNAGYRVGYTVNTDDRGSLRAFGSQSSEAEVNVLLQQQASGSKSLIRANLGQSNNNQLDGEFL